MSALLTVTAHLSAAVPAAGDGILNWIGDKNAETLTMLRAVAVTLAIVFVIWQALASRGAMARVIMAGLAAGVFVWIVFNVTDLRDRVDQEVNASAPGVVQLVDDAAAWTSWS